MYFIHILVFGFCLVETSPGLDYEIIWMVSIDKVISDSGERDECSVWRCSEEGAIPVQTHCYLYLPAGLLGLPLLFYSLFSFLLCFLPKFKFSNPNLVTCCIPHDSIFLLHKKLLFTATISSTLRYDPMLNWTHQHSLWHTHTWPPVPPSVSSVGLQDWHPAPKIPSTHVRQSGYKPISEVCNPQLRLHTPRSHLSGDTHTHTHILENKSDSCRLFYSICDIMYMLYRGRIIIIYMHMCCCQVFVHAKCFMVNLSKCGMNVTVQTQHITLFQKGHEIHTHKNK